MHGQEQDQQLQWTEEEVEDDRRRKEGFQGPGPGDKYSSANPTDSSR